MEILNRLSDILDDEIKRRAPFEGPHRQVAGAAIMDSELFLKISEGEKGTRRIETFLIFSVAALRLAAMPGSAWTDEFMPDAQASSRFFKKGGDVPFAVREAVGKLKTVVSLDTFPTDSPLLQTMP